MSQGGWSNDQLTSLTLPQGATSGARIVLDGTRDVILVYNSLSQLFASLAAGAGSDGLGNNFPQGFKVGVSGSAGVVIQPGSDGRTGIIFFPGIVPNVSNDAHLQLNQQGVGTAQHSFLTIASAVDTTQNDAVFINWHASPRDGTTFAKLTFAYQDPASVVHDYAVMDLSGLAVTGSITAVQPGTGTSRVNVAAAETWHAVAYANGWADFAGHQAVRYRKSPENRVWLDGDAAPGTWANGTVIFTLPVGYRPTALHSIIKQTEGNAGGTFSYDIGTDGTVKINDIVGAVPPIADFTGISFPLD